MTKKIPKNRQNEQYWLNREKQQQAYIDKNLASDEQYNKVIQAQYDSLLADINKRIDSELSKLANENGISIADMRVKVSQTDIKQFEAEAKRVVAQADKMRKQGKSPKLADWSQEVNDRLRLYNATMRINRLEYLKAGIGLDMITAGLQVDSELRDKLFKDATEEQKRQAGILSENNAHIDTLAIGNIILAKTKSNNFSQRIWTNMDVLQAKLSQTIMTGITTGQSYDEMARRLKAQVSKDIQNVTYATQRIARTETARVQTEITMNSLKRNGYDFCKWYKEPSACHDCALIGNQDNGWGKGIYKVKDVPTIPVHPNCRCAVGAYWVDEKNNLYKETIKKNLVSGLERKKNKSKRITINKERQRKLTASFRKNGGKIWQDAGAEAYLKVRGVNAVALSEDLIALKNRPTISEILEELYHVEQFKDGKIDVTNISRYKAEIEAQNYLLSVKKLYNIPEEEILETKANLQYWKEKLENERNKNH